MEYLLITPGDPAFAIAESPGNDGNDRPVIQDDVEVAPIEARHLGIPSRDVGGRFAIDDIQLGDHDFEAVVGDRFEEAGETLLVKVIGESRGEMALDANGIDRCVPPAES